MKLCTNKLGKLQLFWFFDYSFTKKKKLHLPLSHKIPKKNSLQGLRVPNFHKKKKKMLKLKNVKSHKSCGKLLNHWKTLKHLLQRNQITYQQS